MEMTAMIIVALLVLVFKVGFTVAACTTLQTAFQTGISGNCEDNTYNGIQLPDCINHLNDANVYSVEYSPSSERCVTGNCPGLEFKSKLIGHGLRVYRYTCDTDCLNFQLDMRLFTKATSTPTHTLPSTPSDECVAQCFDTPNCTMFSSDSSTCYLHTDCGTSGCPTTFTLSSMYSRNCDIGPYSTVTPDTTPAGSTTLTPSSTTHTPNTTTNVPTISTPLSTSASFITSTTLTSHLSEPTTGTKTSFITLSSSTLTPLSTTYSSTSSSATSVTDTSSSTSTGSSEVTDSTSTASATGTSSTVSSTVSVTSSRIYIRPCLCNVNKAFGNKTEDEILEILRQELTIDTKKTAQAQRKLTSVMDTRTSAQGIGAAGTVMLSLLGFVIVLFDLTKFCKSCPCSIK